MQKLLIVDDDAHLRKLVLTYAELDGFGCVEAEDGIAAIENVNSSVEPEHEPVTELTIGTRLTIDDREFEIDRVNTEWDKISLRDISFQNSTGFLIFRDESIQFVREVLAAQDEHQQLMELVSDKLSESGWTVTDELVRNGIQDYHSRGGKGSYEDIADFIEDEFLSEEMESELPDVLAVSGYEKVYT